MQPRLAAALKSIVNRGDFIPSLPDEASTAVPAAGAPAPIETDPAIVDNPADVREGREAVRRRRPRLGVAG